MVLPVLNEEEQIEGAIHSIRQNFDGELLVVDGGSVDSTSQRVQRLRERILQGPKGLANQCNYGAERASGEILLFLGADVRLPPDWQSVLLRAMRSPYVLGGGFRLQIAGPGAFFSLITFGGNWRARSAGFSNPDQGLFVRRSELEAIGGFDVTSRIPFAKVSRSLRRRGEFRFLPTSVVSSPRKWLVHGKLRTTLHHLRVYLQYLWFEC